MSGGDAWGKDGSKSAVACFYCGEECRKDNLNRHTNRKHPGKIPKSKIISVPGQQKLGFLVRNKETSQNANIANDAYQETAVTTDTGAVANTSFLGKRRRESKEAEEEVSMTEMHTGVQEQLKEFKTNIMKLLDEKLEQLKLKDERHSRERRGTNQEEDSSSVTREQINACRTLQQLIDLVGSEFHFDFDQSMVFCKICISDSRQPVGLRDSRVGVFKLNFVFEDEIRPTQSDALRRLKAHLVEHVCESATHKFIAEEENLRKIREKENASRLYNVGMRIARIRYNGILQYRSYLDFEKDLLLAHLNGMDIGDINHSADFGKSLTNDIHTIIKNRIKINLDSPLESTGKKRPVALIADKITPNKRTGHIMGLVVPIPENSLSSDFLVSIMLGSSVVKEHDAIGLATSMLKEFREFGATDSQLEGVAVDGQYIKLGIKRRLLEQMNVEGMQHEYLSEWFTVMWDPSHNINRADHYIREMPIFKWLNDTIKVIGDISSTLNIGKGLEQMIEASEELNQRLYKLHGYSETRFAQYCHHSFSSFEKSYPVIIEALKERERAGDRDVRDAASRYLKAIRSECFVATLCGVMDIYNSVAKTSCSLQKVDVMPWEVVAMLENGVQELRCMNSELEELGTEKNGTNDTNPEDYASWPIFAQNIKEITKGKLKGISTIEEERRPLRSAADEGDISSLITVRNRLQSLTKNYADLIESRVLKNEKHPYPTVIKSMAGCFDLNLLHEASKNGDFLTQEYGVQCLRKIMDFANIQEDQQHIMIAQYNVFKQRFLDITSDEDKNCLENIFLYKTHQCSKSCTSSRPQQCQYFRSIELPKRIISSKFLHKFLKDDSLYSGIEDLLHLFLRCALKTHVESVAESMGSIIDLHSDKRRGIDVRVVGEESMIHWNGPPVSKANELLESALDAHFGGRRNWHFITRQNKPESTVIARLKRGTVRVPWF
eukprot:gene4949-5598_t